MADISSYLKAILEAIYGEEVRGSIHDALAAMNTEANDAMTFAATAQDSARALAALARESADTAVAKAGEIVDSANAAKLSETNARDAESNAKDSAIAAAASQVASKTSEMNAAKSETVAAQKADEAEASKIAAALSEVNTTAAEQRVKGVKTEVETLRAQASDDKNAAEAAKDAAKASQDAALLSATGAAKSADAANDAKNAAVTAQSAAEDAQYAAETAQFAAETAQFAAEASKDAAKTSETNAASSADIAKQYSGKSPKPQDGTWWLWNADTGEYEDTGIACDMIGPTGNGIESLTQISGNHMPGSTDVYEVKMTDGTKTEIPVYNGRNGTGVGDLIGISFDIEIPVSSWINGKVTISDSRFLASARYKYFIDTYDPCREEVKESKIVPQDITANGYITFTSEYTPLANVTFNILRVEIGSSGETP